MSVRTFTSVLTMLTVLWRSGVVLAEEDTSKATTPGSWNEAVQAAEVSFQQVTDHWKSLRGQGAQANGIPNAHREENLLLELQEAGVERSTLQTGLDMAEWELRNRNRQKNELMERRTSGLTRQADLQRDVEMRTTDCLAAWDTLLAVAEREGSRERVRMRAQGWWDKRRELMSREAWAQDQSVESVLQQEENLDEILERFDPDVHLAFRMLRAAARMEMDARHRLFTFEEENRLAPDRASQLQEEIDSWTQRCMAARQAYLAAVDKETRLAADLDAIRRGGAAAGSAVRTAFIASLERLDSDYAYLRDWSERAPEPIPAQDWCVIHVHGGMVALLAGQDNAQDLLRTGVAAWDGACMGTVFPLMEQPLFQAAWAKALFLEAGEPLIPLAVWAHNGDWTLDGQPLKGHGRIPVLLRPGVHRFEFQDVEGKRFVMVEDFRQLEEGERTQVFASTAGIYSQRVLPGVTEWALPPPLQVEPVDPVPVPVVVRELWGEQPWGSLAAGFTWMSWDTRQHLGYGLAVTWTALSRPFWQLDVGVSHHQLWGSALYRYNETRVDTALYRERLTVRGRLWRQRRVQGSIQLAVGAIPPSHALVADAALGAAWRFSPRFSLMGQAGVAGSWWDLPGVAFWNGENTGAEPWGELALEVRL